MNLLIYGIKGTMGRKIKDLALDDDYWSNIYGLDRKTTRPKEGINFHAMIDFSHQSSLDQVLDIALGARIPLVIGTTGYSKDQLGKIQAASNRIPLLYSSNMSLGMNLMFDLVEKIAASLKDGVDIEILDYHHNRKKDAPSGSTVTIVESIERGLGESRPHQHGRQGQVSRNKGEIGIHAIRAGNIVGRHEANFINELEAIKISHEAFDRRVFAKGALEAAKFIIGKEAKLYTMKNILGK